MSVDEKGLMERKSITDACKGNTNLDVSKKPPAPESITSKKGKK
jgi:hypothetical protein